MNKDKTTTTPARPGWPAPTRASRELPDLERVRALGIEGLTLEQAWLVATALSLYIAKGRSKTRSKVSVMTSALVAACRVEMVRDGRVEPAALPDLPTTGWPQGKTALQRLGIEREQLEGYWVAARNRADDACLPIEWLLAFAPAPLWPPVWTLVGWGPFEAAARVEEAMTVLAQTPIRHGTRRRPEGALLALGTLESRVDCLWGLMQALIELHNKVQASRNRSLPLDLLAQWTFKPERIDLEACGAKEARIDTSGPPIRDCAVLLQRLYREWQEALPQRRYRRLRRLLLLAILALYGPREDALRTLGVDDYLPDHLFPDGVRGPALRFYPGKTRAHDEPYILPLPAELAEWIEEWIRYTGRSLGQPDQPLWPSRKPKPGQSVRRIGATGLYCAIAGREGVNGNSQPLLPRGDNPHEGYNPHAYRHTAYQAAKRAGVKAKEASPYEFAHVDPEDFARAVCGHHLKQSVKDAYLDLNRQQLARAAVEHAWHDLWADGKRQGLDPEAISQAQHEVATLHAASEMLELDLRTLHQRQSDLAKRARSLNGDALHAALIESNQISAEIQMTIRDLNRLSDQLTQARKRLDDALTTPVPLPDDVTDEQHALLLAQALGQAAETDDELDGPLATALTPDELAEIYGCSPQTINAWVRNGLPRGKHYWQPDAWIDPGTRKKLLPVSAINQDVLTETQKKRLLKVRKQRALRTAA